MHFNIASQEQNKFTIYPGTYEFPSQRHLPRLTGSEMHYQVRNMTHIQSERFSYSHNNYATIVPVSLSCMSDQYCNIPSPHLLRLWITLLFHNTSSWHCSFQHNEFQLERGCLACISVSHSQSKQYLHKHGLTVKFGGQPRMMARASMFLAASGSSQMNNSQSCVSYLLVGVCLIIVGF